MIVPESGTLQIKTFPTKGVYTLIIFLSKELSLNVGKLGIKKFPKGYYTYTGSTMGDRGLNLKSRVSRHLRKGTRKHWHIDYLLAHQNAKVTAVVAAQAKKRLECTINRHLKEKGKAKIQFKALVPPTTGKTAKVISYTLMKIISRLKLQCSMLSDLVLSLLSSISANDS